MAKKIREFMTHRDPDEHIWVEREESAVIGTARMGQRMVPKIRPFDLLRSALRSANCTQAMVWEGDSLRIATEHIDGLEEQLFTVAGWSSRKLSIISPKEKRGLRFSERKI